MSTVPPKWIVEPSDVSVERNKNIIIHCQAHGVPTPTLTWKKATGNRRLILIKSSHIFIAGVM